jgi:hypothetical protein
MPLFSASANVRRESTDVVAGAAMVERFALENSTRVEKSIRIADAQAFDRAASKRMAAIGLELGERELMPLT